MQSKLSVILQFAIGVAHLMAAQKAKRVSGPVWKKEKELDAEVEVEVVVFVDTPSAVWFHFQNPNPFNAPATKCLMSTDIAVIFCSGFRCPLRTWGKQQKPAIYGRPDTIS
uniref:HDC07166 n=1 Tax=Drosophila melanogaster TaxID=7227 RepID=Q6IG60_DROME|nr:TPA_inf: HDC07166 [Drosophila melanogaster]